MPTVFKEIQDSSKDEATSEQMQEQKEPQSLGSTPDVILEHGKTRLTLDLDGWEWFWLFLGVTIVAISWAVSQSFFE
jgi:hypothetical protein